MANQWKDTVAVVEAESYIEHAGHKHISLFDRLDWKISSLLLCCLRQSGNSIQVALVLFISSAALLTYLGRESSALETRVDYQVPYATYI